MNKQPMIAATTTTIKADNIKPFVQLKPTDQIKPPKKYERVLMQIVTHGSINRLEAEKKPIFEHTLNSTMSDFKKRMGLCFTSIPEKTTGYNGLGAIYNRYALTDKSTIKAKRLINEYRTRRGASLIQWEGAA